MIVLIAVIAADTAVLIPETTAPMISKIPVAKVPKNFKAAPRLLRIIGIMKSLIKL